jgi:hypothetical protein
MLERQGVDDAQFIDIIIAMTVFQWSIDTGATQWIP